MTERKIDMVFIMLTNILEENTYMICAGEGAGELITRAYHVHEEDGYYLLKGVVSRKKSADPHVYVSSPGAVKYGKTVLESRQYAVSRACRYGKLPAAGRKTEYYYHCVGGDRLFFSGHGFHLSAPGAVFL